MGAAAFRPKSQGTRTQDKSVPACNAHAQRGERERGCWRHLKLAWESCATASYLHRYWPSLSHSVACVSVCLQASQSGSVTLCCFSSWLLRSSLHHPLLSRSVSFILHFHSSIIPLSLLFFLLHSLLFFSFWSLWSFPMLNFPQFPCPVISLLHLVLFSHSRPPPPSFPLLSYSLAEEEEDKMWAKFAGS